jgi:ubiquinone/menaquinone biosynthesis C-methylase UbiE
MPAQSHRSDPRILERRTLQRDHRVLAVRLRPGHAVLDVGCGTGAITSGIAKAVRPQGYVVGVDRDPGLLEIARREHSGLPNLTFELGDATSLGFRSQFDVVTAARTLQWIAEPGVALLNMRRAAKPAGLIVVLDYNHARNKWEPEPPEEFIHFYRAFLAWRQSNQWDNEIADHLPELFRSAGLAGIESHIQDEVVARGDQEFPERSALWSEVIENVGEQIAKTGFCTESQLREARERYDSWAKTDLVRQTLTMRAVTGRVA